MKNVFWDIKASSYLIGNTLRLRYRAQPVNAMQDLRYSRRRLRKMPPSGMLCLVVPVRTDVSEEHTAAIIKVTRIRELGTTLAVTSSYFAA
jgi:hypothetical protein